MASAEFVLPDQLTRKLGRLQSQVKRLAAMKGVCVFCMVSIGCVAAAMLVDLYFDLSEQARAAALGSVAIVSLLTLWRVVLRPLLTNMSPAELAAMVEITHPELNEQLTSTIELNDPDVPESHKGSALMRELLTQQTLKHVGDLDFSDSVSASRTFRMTLIAAASVMVFLFPNLVAGDSYKLLLSRLFMPFGNYATVGSLVFTVEPGDQIAAHGDDVTLNAKVEYRTGGAAKPEAVWLHWTNADGEAEQKRMEFQESATAFEAMLPAVVSDFDFHISAENSRSRFYRVTVVERPELTSATLDVEPPAYVGFPAKTIDGIVGDIHVHERSGLRFHLKFNKPVAKAELQWLQGQQIPNATLADNQKLPAVQRFEIANDGLSATLKTTALISGPFSLVLTDMHELTNQDEPRRNLVISIDQPPQLIVEGDAKPRSVRPDDVVPIRVETTDDLGIGALELHFSVLTDEDVETVDAVDPATLGQQEIGHTFRLDLSALELKSGAVVSYRVRAADQRPVPEPNEVWSDERLLNISDSAQPPGTEELAQRQRELKDELRKIREGVEKNSKQVSELHNDAEGDLRMQLEFSRNKEIAPLALAEVELAERLENLSNRFAENRLYANLVPEVREIAREELPKTSQKLRNAAEADLRKKADTLSASVGDLNRIADTLRDIEKEFDKLASLERDLLELNRLAERARALSEQTVELDRRSREIPDGETAEQRQQREKELIGEMRELAAQQQELSKQLQDLLQRRPELVEAARADQLDRLAELSKRALELAKPQDMLAEALRKEAKRATIKVMPLPDRQQELNKAVNDLLAAAENQQANAPVTPVDPLALRKALEALKGGDKAEAQKQQKAAAEELERLAAELRKNERLADDPQEAVAQLAKRQRELQQKADEAAKSAPAADATDEQKQQFQQQMRNLAAEQAAVQAGTARVDLPSRNREQQQKAVNDSAEAVGEFLKNDAKQAADVAKQASEQLEELAKQIGNEDQRRQAAADQVAQLQKQQEAVGKKVDETIDEANRSRRSKAEEQLQTLAKQQNDLARKLADLDAPGAQEQQRAAVEKSAQALLDLEQGRTADAQGSQSQAEQALSRLKQKLAGQDLPEVKLAELQKKQEELNQEAKRLQQNSDRPRLADAAKQQDQLSEQLRKIDAPAAKAQKQEAVDASNALAEQMRDLKGDSEDLNQATERASEALQQLAKAVQPQQSNPAEMAEQLAKQQKTSEQQAQQQAEANQAPSVAQRQQNANQLARTSEAAQQLRVGAGAAEDKQTAMKELAEAAEAQEKLDEFVERLEARKQTPEQIAENKRVQNLMEQNVDAQGDAADALEQLRQTLAEEPQNTDQQQVAQKANELSQQASPASSPSEVAKAAEKLANEQAEVRQQTEKLAGQPNRPASTPQSLQQQQQQLQQQAEQLPADVAALPRAEAVQHLEQAQEALENGNLAEATEQQQQAEQALRDVQQQAQAMAQNQPSQNGGQPSNPSNPMSGQESGQPQQAQPSSPSSEQLAERAAELAQQQRELAQASENSNPSNSSEQPSNSESPNNASESSNSGPPPHVAETVSAQQQLTQDAAQLALDIARSEGPDSPAAQEASNMVKLSGG